MARSSCARATTSTGRRISRDRRGDLGAAGRRRAPRWRTRRARRQGPQRFLAAAAHAAGHVERHAALRRVRPARPGRHRPVTHAADRTQATAPRAAGLPARATSWSTAGMSSGTAPKSLPRAARKASKASSASAIDAHYSQSRNAQWVKVKHAQSDEFAIVGYTAPRGARTGFGSLLMAVADKGKLRYAGRVGTGYDDATLRKLLAQLKPLQRKTATVELPAHLPYDKRDNGNVHWVEPKLVAEVAFRGWGKEGLLRQASFQRLRIDKTVEDLGMASRSTASKKTGAATKTASRRKSRRKRRRRPLPPKWKSAVPIASSTRPRRSARATSPITTAASPTGSCRNWRAGRCRWCAVPTARTGSASSRSTTPPRSARTCRRSR